jgi:hypothetical protein
VWLSIDVRDMSNRRVVVKRQMVDAVVTWRGGDDDPKKGKIEHIERVEMSDQEKIDLFNRQVVESRIQIQRVHQQSRLLDKDAAVLIAGSAGLQLRVVWVDCNMEADWFDKNDGKKLMSVAWDEVIGESNKTIRGHASMLHNDLGTDYPEDVLNPTRIKNIKRVLKSFRQSQLTMQLFSLSPSTEAAMSGVVIDTLDRFESAFSRLDDTAEMRTEIRSSVFEHDDRTRRMSRMFRRLPFTRNEFCRVVGIILRYNISMQDGIALSTRRLNQVQFDMRKAVESWMQFMDRNLDRIIKELTEFWTDYLHFYVFDWSTHRMKIIDSDQYNYQDAPQNASVVEEVMSQEINGERICKLATDTTEILDELENERSAATHGTGIGYAASPTGNSVESVVNPSVYSSINRRDGGWQW